MPRGQPLVFVAGVEQEMEEVWVWARVRVRMDAGAIFLRLFSSFPPIAAKSVWRRCWCFH